MVRDRPASANCCSERRRLRQASKAGCQRPPRLRGRRGSRRRRRKRRLRRRRPASRQRGSPQQAPRSQRRVCLRSPKPAPACRTSSSTTRRRARYPTATMSRATPEPVRAALRRSSRSGPSPTRHRVASMPRLRSSANAATTSRTRLTGVIRPIQPTTNRLVGNAEQASQLVATVSPPDSTLEVDAESDDGELLRRCDAERHQVVLHLGAHRDQPRCVPGEKGLGLLEHRGPHRVEVAAQHMPVEGVHDDRRPSISGQDRGEPSDRTGLRRVGVQDVRADPADLFDDPLDAHGIVDRRKLPLECGTRTNEISASLGDEVHRILRRVRARRRAASSRSLGWRARGSGT